MLFVRHHPFIILVGPIQLDLPCIPVNRQYNIFILISYIILITGIFIIASFYYIKNQESFLESSLDSILDFLPDHYSKQYHDQIAKEVLTVPPVKGIPQSNNFLATLPVLNLLQQYK